MKIVKGFDAYHGLNEAHARGNKEVNVRVTKEFSDNLNKLVEVMSNLETLEAQVKILKNTTNGLEGWIKTEMAEKYKADMIRVGKVVVALKEQRGSVKPAYKGMKEDLSALIVRLVKDAEKAAKIIQTIVDKHTPEAKTHTELHFAVDEGVAGNWAKGKLEDLKAWLKKQFSALSKIVSSMNKTAGQIGKKLGLNLNESENGYDDCSSEDLEGSIRGFVSDLEGQYNCNPEEIATALENVAATYRKTVQAYSAGPVDESKPASKCCGQRLAGGRCAKCYTAQ